MQREEKTQLAQTWGRRNRDQRDKGNRSWVNGSESETIGYPGENGAEVDGENIPTSKYSSQHLAT